MDVLSNEWWGEPLDTMMSRILVQELNQRLPGSTVYATAALSPPRRTQRWRSTCNGSTSTGKGDVLLAAQIAVDGKRTAVARRGASRCGRRTRRPRPWSRQ